MPELPEVETIRRDLEPLIVGRRIVGVDVDAGTIQRLADVPIETLRAALVGRRFTALGRRGKYLLFALDDGRTFIAHLRMTGRLTWRPHDAPVEPYERAHLSLSGGFDLRWSDLRKFGTWRLVDDHEVVTFALGPEPIDPKFTPVHFRALLRGLVAPVKAVLLDQRRISGIGNIYADEALFEARIRPDVPAGTLSPAATRRLHAACRSVLERGIVHRGASFSDYVDALGNPGQQQAHVRVFRRDGKPCYVCGATIERTVVAGRGTHFCPRCQPSRPPRRGQEKKSS